MEAQIVQAPAVADQKVGHEARRILRRLCEKSAFLAMAPDMEKAVILREVSPGRHDRVAVVERRVADAFRSQDWIACVKAGPIERYAITPAGRSRLKCLITRDQAARSRTVAPTLQDQRLDGEDLVIEQSGGKPRAARINLAETPLMVLGRKTDPDGAPYLTPDLIEAGERLREDFERAELGAPFAPNWDRLLAGSDNGDVAPSLGGNDDRTVAFERLVVALRELGPGLKDIALRVCCLLEGLESAEKRLGWPARSGKVVLRIALQRLAAHSAWTKRPKSRPQSPGGSERRGGATPYLTGPDGGVPSSIAIPCRPSAANDRFICREVAL